MILRIKLTRTDTDHGLDKESKNQLIQSDKHGVYTQICTVSALKDDEFMAIAQMVDRNTPEIKLYGYPTSPFVQKVSCYLTYKQLHYQFIGVNPITSQQIAFTRQRQVPVLKVGDEWRLESSAIGLWLDELFPEIPLLEPEGTRRASLLDIDHWISRQLIPFFFRQIVEWRSHIQGLRDGWRLSAAMHKANPLPAWVRLLWPYLFRKASFITSMVEQLDSNETLVEMQQRLINQFLTFRGKGPFLGENKTPSLADLSAFPAITTGHMLGLDGYKPWLDNQVIMSWCQSIQNHLPQWHLPIAKQQLKYSLQQDFPLQR